MTSDDLTKKKCVPCEGGVEPFGKEGIEQYNSVLKTRWDVLEDKKIARTFKFKDFIKAMEFVNAVADIAESEGHHPDIYIYYNKVKLELWTHAIGGLSINDFIMAAKIERLP